MNILPMTDDETKSLYCALQEECNNSELTCGELIQLERLKYKVRELIIGIKDKGHE